MYGQRAMSGTEGDVTLAIWLLVVVFEELAVKEPARLLPLPFSGPQAAVKGFGDLYEGLAAEKMHLDDARLPLVQLGEAQPGSH